MPVQVENKVVIVGIVNGVTRVFEWFGDQKNLDRLRDFVDKQTVILGRDLHKQGWVATKDAASLAGKPVVVIKGKVTK